MARFAWPHRRPPQVLSAVVLRSLLYLGQATNGDLAPGPTGDDITGKIFKSRGPGWHHPRGARVTQTEK
ncbi:MAG: hypothetical protein N2512_14220 [Armatimonadetes bacterium]|nr:hypothetical protein [Armatimonadota bacterium]